MSEQNEQDLAHVDNLRDSSARATGGQNTLIRRFRTEEQLRKTLAMLANFVWYGRPSPGDHVWSIPVDEERDFDCILSDAIDELVEWRAVAKAREAGSAEADRLRPDGESQKPSLPDPPEPG